MQFKKLLMLLFIGATFGIQAQDQLVFPVSGTYTVQNEEGQPVKKYDQVSITSNTFLISLNGQALKYFRLVSGEATGYQVEQYFLDNDDPKRDRERFTVQIDSTTANECFITLVFPFGTEQVHLLKE